MGTIQPQDFRDSLSMIDETGHRKFILTSEVRGWWHSYRTVAQTFLILFFLVLPWVKVGGHQAVLLNIPGREFAFFGLHFFAHDTPLLFFVLGFLTVGMALATTLLGRVWCGWTCPQTVFLDGLFRPIERLTEGNYLNRLRISREEMTFNTFLRKVAKWSLFLLATYVLTHSLLAYFVGSDRLLAMIQTDPSQNMTPFVIVMVLWGILLFDLAWFREQFCIIMCPYGRFQSVLYDKHTVTVQYDATRGEPRKGASLSPGQNTGDCVNCRRCVQVCPTGIDIRNGVQMECVACTACVDACDEIMEKVKKPKGLIRYMNSTGGLATQWLRPRVLLYSLILSGMIGGLTWNILNRKDFEVSLLRALDTPYLLRENQGETFVSNSYRIHVRNLRGEAKTFSVALRDPEQAQRFKISVPEFLMTFAPGELKMIPISVEALKNNTRIGEKLKLQFDKQEFEVSFVSP